MTITIHTPIRSGTHRLQQNLKKLELGILTAADPDAISPGQYEALDCARRDPFNPAFRSELPLIVAQFKEAAAQEIMGWASRQDEEYDALIVNSIITRRHKHHDIFDLDRRLVQFAHMYGEDMGAINRALLGYGIDETSATAGLFTKTPAFGRYDTPTSVLHMDTLDQPGVRYIARLGALPFAGMKGFHTLDMSTELKELISTARNDNKTALEKLLHDQLLEPVGLGAVAMLYSPAKDLISNRRLPPDAGTLHSSSPVPVGGVHSALFQAASHFPAP